MDPGLVVMVGGFVGAIGIGVFASRRRVRGDFLAFRPAPNDAPDGPRPILSADGVKDFDGVKVDVHMSSPSRAGSEWSLSAPVKAPVGFATALPLVGAVDPRFASSALDEARKKFAKSPVRVVRLAVSDRALHVHGEGKFFAMDERAHVEDVATDIARLLVKAARALDTSFATLSLETRTCPRCTDVALELSVGKWGEDRCPACRIHFFPTAMAARLFDALHLDPHTLKNSGVSARGDIACAACASRMAPVLCEHVILDLCKGCGSLLLDEGELEELLPGAS